MIFQNIDKKGFIYVIEITTKGNFSFLCILELGNEDSEYKKTWLLLQK